MEDIKLTDLVEQYILQEIQDSFISRSGIAVGISGADGIGLTNPCDLKDFCQVLTKGTEEGLRRCTECDCDNARKVLETGQICSYKCHAGLVDFSAPIVVDDMFFGFVVGGQVSSEPLEKEKIYAYADELGIDREAYWEAAQDIKVVEEEKLAAVLEHTEKVAKMISDIASNKYHVMLANAEIEAAAKMKSDFLANMSHEIRTPMNAVIGMADMALREELSPNARKYVRQIKNSSHALLGIINDILDFSKIEAGKMDITMTEYSPYEVIDEVSNIIATRIKDKDIEFIVDVSPDIPDRLMGDSVRIRQVIINLANNAVKFTNQGKVVLRVNCEKTSPTSYQLDVSVEDTGIGIKEHDLAKIFESFQQVDSKRNRNIEGSGLGLAISRQLISLMGGELKVESEYGVGSTFSFTIQQLMLGSYEPFSIEDGKNTKVAAWISNPYVEQQLCKDVRRLGCQYNEIMTTDQLDMVIEEAYKYLFVDSVIYDHFVKDHMDRLQNVTVVMLVRFDQDYKPEFDNLMVLKKPLSTYHLYKLFNHMDVQAYNEDDVWEIDFNAPDAEVLVVDDNEINLDVAIGLLEPLNMKIERAESGKKAIDLISSKHYDLVFMDHMMPEMDGIETTRIIRRFHPEYDNVPIIALTANALEETKAMFLCEGMNDFVAKPIEVKTLTEAVRNWLPPGKVIPVTVKKQEKQDIPNIPELDMEHAKKLMGSSKVLWSVIENYYKSIPKKSRLIEDLVKQGDWERYTIEVHALKSASRQIGAEWIGELAECLEYAGKEGNVRLILDKTDELVTEYRSLGDILGNYFPEDEAEGKDKMPEAELMNCLDNLLAAAADLDSEIMEKELLCMKNYHFEGEAGRLFESLKDAVDSLDVDACEDIINEWKVL